MSEAVQPLDLTAIRALFPALRRQHADQPAIYFDGPGGTQVPESVIGAIGDYLRQGGANLSDQFPAGRYTIATAEAARAAVADLLNAQPTEIAFGQNMTSLTFSLSRALARTWAAGDEIIVTRLDHDANVAPWLAAAADRDVTVRWLDINPADCTLRLETLGELLTPRTRLLAITAASNAVGSMTPIAQVAALAHRVGALVYVDAVHFAPHALIDVQALDCDFLACSVYKFFGPHTGVLYGRYALLAALEAYKVRPSPALPPGKWETGTQSFESLAGVTAAVDYLASLGTGATRRAQLVTAFDRISAHEQALSAYFLQHATTVPGLKVYGITDIERLGERTPTFAVSLAGWSAADLARALGDRGIYVYAGHYYAVEVMRRLGLLEQGGLVRIGFVHYNTQREIDRLTATLHALAR